MTIYHVKGGGAAVAMVANALRNNAIAQGGGGLLLGAAQADADPRRLAEKVIAGAALPDDRPQPAKDVPFKGGGGAAVAVVVADAAGRKLLDAIEAACPGFAAACGPEVTLTIVAKGKG